MSTSYPGAVDSFPARSNGQTIQAAHVQNLQDAVAAIETELGTNPSGAATSVASSLLEIRARELSPAQAEYGLSTGGSAAANSTAITTCLADANTAGTSVVIPGGTYAHQGITYPADGRVNLRGAGVGKTVLNNTHASNASIAATGVGGAGPTPYCERFKISDLTLSASAIHAGQYGLALTLCTRFAIEDVFVEKHADGARIVSAWRGSFRGVEANSNTNGFHFTSGYAGSTPLTFIDCHAGDNTGIGVWIEDAVEGLVWHGGDVDHNGTGMVITGNSSKVLTFTGLNFESNTGLDVQIGNVSTTPNSVNLNNCRHLRGSTGTLAIDHQNGGPVNIVGCYFGNYTTAIHQSNVTGILSVVNPFVTGVTNFINSDNQGVISDAGFILAAPWHATSWNP